MGVIIIISSLLWEWFSVSATSKGQNLRKGSILASMWEGSVNIRPFCPQHRLLCTRDPHSPHTASGPFRLCLPQRHVAPARNSLLARRPAHNSTQEIPVESNSIFLLLSGDFCEAFSISPHRPYSPVLSVGRQEPCEGETHMGSGPVVPPHQGLKVGWSPFVNMP